MKEKHDEHVEGASPSGAARPHVKANGSVAADLDRKQKAGRGGVADHISIHSAKSDKKSGPRGSQKWHGHPALVRKRKKDTLDIASEIASSRWPGGVLPPWRLDKARSLARKGKLAVSIASDSSTINPSKFLVGLARDHAEKHLKARIKQEYIQTELAELRASTAAAELEQLQAQQTVIEGSQESSEEESSDAPASEDDRLQERLRLLQAPSTGGTR